MLCPTIIMYDVNLYFILGLLIDICVPLSLQVDTCDPEIKVSVKKLAQLIYCII
jgi:hypothetical protein